MYRQIFPVLVVNGWVVSTAAVGGKYKKYFWYIPHETVSSMVGDGARERERREAWERPERRVCSVEDSVHCTITPKEVLV